MGSQWRQLSGMALVVVKNKEVIGKMADAVQSVADKMTSWPEAKSWEEDIKRYQKNASFSGMHRRASVVHRRISKSDGEVVGCPGILRS